MLKAYPLTEKGVCRRAIVLTYHEHAAQVN